MLVFLLCSLGQGAASLLDILDGQWVEEGQFEDADDLIVPPGLTLLADSLTEPSDLLSGCRQLMTVAVGVKAVRWDGGHALARSDSEVPYMPLPGWDVVVEAVFASLQAALQYSPFAPFLAQR